MTASGTDRPVQIQRALSRYLYGKKERRGRMVFLPLPSVFKCRASMLRSTNMQGQMWSQYYTYPAPALPGELSGVAKFFLVTGCTDMHNSIDGLIAIAWDTYELDPYSNSLFLFCGRRCDRIKALHFEGDGFCLYYKRMDNGQFQWPRDSSEVRNLTCQEYRWLLEGLSIDQTKTMRNRQYS